MGVTLSDRARRHIALFEDETGVSPRDCVIEEEYDRVLFVVAPADVKRAIGPGGRTVARVEDSLGTEVKVIEDADTPEDFVANALAPAAVYGVTISEGEETIAYAEVDDADKGVAIGEDGRNVEAARLLAKRHFDVDDVQFS